MMIWQTLSGNIGVMMMIMMHDDLAKPVEGNPHDDYDAMFMPLEPVTCLRHRSANHKSRGGEHRAGQDPPGTS